MTNEESMAFGLFDAGDEDCNEFVGFLVEVVEESLRDYFALNEQLQPVGRLFEFLQAAFEFADELSVRSRPTAFPIVGTNGGAGFQNLVADYTPCRRIWQGIAQPDYP